MDIAVAAAVLEEILPSQDVFLLLKETNNAGAIQQTDQTFDLFPLLSYWVGWDSFFCTFPV